MQRKYGLYILPTGETLDKLQLTINQIAEEHNAIKFIPHVSIAGILIREEDLDSVKNKVQQLTSKMTKFPIQLKSIGYMDEKHRSLYLFAESDALPALFKMTTQFFPEAQIERNRLMPHLSILYGNFPEATKKEIISKYPIDKLNFEATGLDLCDTNGNEEEWHSIYHSSFN